MRAAASCLALLLAGSAASAQPFALQSLRHDVTVPAIGHAVEAGEDCAGGIIYDDGVFENGLRFTANDARFAQRTDIAGPGSLNTVCICWQSLASGDSAVNFNIHVYDTAGTGGAPGGLVASIPATAAGIPSGLGGKFYRYDLSSQGINLTGNAYIGVQWNGNQEPGIYLCDDEGPAAPRPAYGSINGGADWVHVILLAPLFEAFGIRAEVGPPAEDPEPPPGDWLTTSNIPAFQFKARIVSGATQITPAIESDCLAETLCLSGALPGRSELFARIIGPRPNGFLWVNLVRFTVSQVEVWVQRRSGGEIRYYKLPAIAGDSNELTGLVDKQAFTP